MLSYATVPKHKFFQSQSTTRERPLPYLQDSFSGYDGSCQFFSSERVVQQQGCSAEKIVAGQSIEMHRVLPFLVIIFEEEEAYMMGRFWCLLKCLVEFLLPE